MNKALKTIGVEYQIVPGDSIDHALSLFAEGITKFIPGKLMRRVPNSDHKLDWLFNTFTNITTSRSYTHNVDQDYTKFTPQQLEYIRLIHEAEVAYMKAINIYMSIKAS